jgi:hypothetical protein
LVGGSPLQERLYTDCAIKEAILSVDMEVDKTSRRHDYDF